LPLPPPPKRTPPGGKQLTPHGDQEKSLPDNETWPTGVASFSRFARARRGHAALPTNRAFAEDELDATIEQHPVLALVPARDLRVEMAHDTGPSAAWEPASAGDAAYDPLLALHPALARLPDRDPRLGIPLAGNAPSESKVARDRKGRSGETG
jgi:hypothetical protein